MATSKEQIGLGLSKPHPPRTSGTIYRILNFCHLVDLFKSGELHFSHPSKWDDKFETRLAHEDMDCVFAQCWSNQFSSDAMWRIYSQNFMGVRISTTPSRFATAIKNANKKGADLRFRLQDVEYLNYAETTLRLSKIRQSLTAEDGQHEAADALFIKRHSFDHEAECRALIIASQCNLDTLHEGLKLKVNPHEFVSGILLDPRIPPQLEEAFTYYIENKLQFKGKVKKSVLYAVPKPM